VNRTHLGNLALHNEEVGIIDVQLNGLEEGLNSGLGCLVSIAEEFRHVRKANLVHCQQGTPGGSVQVIYRSGNCNLLGLLIAWRTFCRVRVIEDDGYAGLGDTSLSTFVDEILLVLGTHLSMSDDVCT